MFLWGYLQKAAIQMKWAKEAKLLLRLLLCSFSLRAVVNVTHGIKTFGDCVACIVIV